MVEPVSLGNGKGELPFVDGAGLEQVALGCLCKPARAVDGLVDVLLAGKAEFDDHVGQEGSLAVGIGWGGDSRHTRS